MDLGVQETGPRNRGLDDVNQHTLVKTGFARESRLESFKDIASGLPLKASQCSIGRSRLLEQRPEN